MLLKSQQKSKQKNIVSSINKVLIHLLLLLLIIIVAIVNITQYYLQLSWFSLH